MRPPSERGSLGGSEGEAGVIAAINVGSSSLKFALFQEAGQYPHVRRLASGKLDRIGTSNSSFTIFDERGSTVSRKRLRLEDQGSAMREVLAWIESGPYHTVLRAVGHRIVHGGRRFSGPRTVTPSVFRALQALAPLDPDHLPAELAGIRTVGRRHPNLLQVACFDTSFHRTLPRVAQLYALPRQWIADGVIRYGFHGLSCEYIVGALASPHDGRRVPSRLVVAHLGSGSSMTAIKDGRSLDTTMGFTPTGGLVMSTRPGDMDPEVVVYLAQHSRQTPAQLTRFLNHKAGLLGVSGTTGDMHDLLRRASKDPRAREAVDLFCYQAQKSLGALTSILGGIDTLVFTGGIGENSPEIRRRISAALDHLGARIDTRRNAKNRPVISSRGSTVEVRVIPTDEERVIAVHTLRALSAGTGHS
jgi:acetate kinase